MTKQLVQKPNRPLSELETPQPKPGTSQPEPQTGSKQNQQTCFRISGIPPHWDRERLKKALQTIEPEFNPMGAEVSGPFPDVYDRTQVALLGLRAGAPYFIFEPNQEKHKVISEDGQRVHLVLDNHFYDLTPLNRAKEPVKVESVNPQKGVFQILTFVPTV